MNGPIERSARRIRRAGIAAAVLAAGCTSASRPAPPELPASHTFHERSFHFGRFSNVALLAPDAEPRAVALLISGSEGFRGEARTIGETLARHGALVGAVELPPYSARNHGRRPNRACVYPAIDFQTLAKRIEEELGFAGYVKPVVVGYRESAAIVVTALAETPPETFAGAVTIDFCPAIDLPVPACPGRGDVRWEPDGTGRAGRILPGFTIPAPWLALASSRPSPACPADEAWRFVSATARAERIDVLSTPGDPGTAVDRAVARSVLRLADEARTSDAHERDALAELPLLEMPATQGESDTMALVVSGDGGWADLDEEIAAFWNAHGIPVVGWNSLRYFWSKRSADETAAALERIVRHYADAWGKRRILLAGYSQGAEVLAGLAHRLPRDLLERVRALALIGAGERLELEFHLSDWLDDGRATRGEPVLPALEALRGQRILCFEGEEEKASICPQLGQELAQVVTLPGGHHFAGDYTGIARAILDAAP